MPRVLVLGAGLVGTFAARALTEEGVATVAADLRPGQEYFRRFGPRRAGELVRVDILDFASVSSLLKSHEVDVIVLTAGLMSEDCERHARKAWGVNFRGPAVVARAALDTGVKRLIFISTFAVYGRSSGARITETTPLQPRSEYGRTKAMAENALTAFRGQGLDVRILRSCGIYGPLRPNRGSRSAKFIEAVLHHALNTRELEIRAAPHTSDEYLYVKDLARAISLAALRDTSSPEFIFNVGAGRRTTVKELCGILRRVAPGLRVKIKAADVEKGPPAATLDTSLIQKVYDFTPHYSLTEGFFDYLQETGLKL